MGHQYVYVYSDGLPGWILHGLPTESSEKYPDIPVKTITGSKLKDMIDNSTDTYILDIRDEDDWDHTGRISGSTGICLDNITKRLNEIPRDRDIVIVDMNGLQSKIAARYLASKGINNLFILKDGFVKGWLKYGYPVHKDR